MRKYQTILVLSLIGVICIICFGYIDNIIEKASKQSAELQTITLMNTVEQMYIETVINDEDTLPFIAIFDNEEMYLKVGTPSKSYIYSGSINVTGKFPKNGEIVISNANKVIASDIQIRNYICNSLKEGEVICKKA
jgi:hypothetical protein